MQARNRTFASAEMKTCIQIAKDPAAGKASHTQRTQRPPLHPLTRAGPLYCRKGLTTFLSWNPKMLETVSAISLEASRGKLEPLPTLGRDCCLGSLSDYRPGWATRLARSQYHLSAFHLRAPYKQYKSVLHSLSWPPVKWLVIMEMFQALQSAMSKHERLGSREGILDWEYGMNPFAKECCY